MECLFTKLCKFLTKNHSVHWNMMRKARRKRSDDLTGIVGRSHDHNHRVTPSWKVEERDVKPFDKHYKHPDVSITLPNKLVSLLSISQINWGQGSIHPIMLQWIMNQSKAIPSRCHQLMSLSTNGTKEPSLSQSLSAASPMITIGETRKKKFNT